MPDMKKTYLYRMTHIMNIPHVLSHGITHRNSPNANPDFIPIGDKGLITKRDNFILDNGKRLGEYIPFYFGIRTPMLYVVQKGYNLVTPTSPENIVYCVSSVQNIIENNHDFIFTDGHAFNSLSTQYYPKDIPNIDNIIDKNATMAIYWNSDNDLDRKRKKDAEFLVLGDINISAIIGYYVFNENAKNILTGLGISETYIRVKSEYYF